MINKHFNEEILKRQFVDIVVDMIIHLYKKKKRYWNLLLFIFIKKGLGVLKTRISLWMKDLALKIMLS